MRFWKEIKRSLFALQTGPAHRVIFYYYGEEPTYLEDAQVTVYRNGMVEVKHRTEHVSTHVQNVEILWKGSPSKTPGGRSLTLVQGDASQEKN